MTTSKLKKWNFKLRKLVPGLLFSSLLINLLVPIEISEAQPAAGMPSSESTTAKKPQSPPPITPSSSHQITQKQIADLVEALRLAAPKIDRKEDSLYSQWQIKPSNIRRWSKKCVGKELTPTEFESDLVTARAILECKMGEVLRQEYRFSGDNVFIAVRRVASWWMTGDGNQYQRGLIGDYTLKVLEFYLQL